MKVLLPIHQAKGADCALVGGKTLALARLGTAGLKIPQALCVTTDAIHRIRTGDMLSVDGYLGIVTRQESNRRAASFG